jgi:predicted RNase H-like nuclease (RuvC/YqgF family)
MTEEKKVENQAVTPAENEKLFTQEQVNKMITDRLGRLYKRYGVDNKESLDELVNKALSYEEMNERYDNVNKDNETLNKQIEELTNNNTDLQSKFDELTNQSKDLTKKYALSSRNIRPELYNDIETYFKGKELEINETTLDEELKTHADWCKPTNVTDLGNEYHGADQVSEKELAAKLLGVEL